MLSTLGYRFDDLGLLVSSDSGYAKLKTIKCHAGAEAAAAAAAATTNHHTTKTLFRISQVSNMDNGRY